ncbi:MAG: helix-turn-helix transcriptional regulator [Clostridia bacterium]|nr:helix-turn-helix transcriptional regulator [Clostridia bacterium]
MPGNIPYSGEKHSDNVAYFVVDFICGLPDEFEKLIAPAVCTPESYEIILSKFSKALQLWSKQQMDVNLKLKSFVYSVICEAFKDNGIKKTTAPVEEILEYIVENLRDSSLRVSSLCDRFFISESQLRRNFIKATGLSPNEYILTLRINKAKNELICTEKAIKQISVECGFSSQYYFSRCFSENTKMTPTEYRKKYYFI